MQRLSVPSDRRYLNVVLTVIAVLLGLQVASTAVSPTGGALESQAAAGPRNTGEPEGLVSAGEQRKQMINELKQLRVRLERIEAALGKGVNVNVKNFPESGSKQD